VYEQFPAYRKAGALLGLAPNGQSAMRAMDPALLDRVVEECVPEGRVITYDGDGVFRRLMLTRAIPEPSRMDVALL